MRFLFFATRYSADASNPYMTDELAEGMIAKGHHVDVLLIDWGAVSPLQALEEKGRNGERIVRTTPRALRNFGKVIFKASKLLFSSRHAAAAMNHFFGDEHYDAVIAFTPALSVGAPLRRAVRMGIRNRLLVVFDFFPICQREAGMIRSRLVYAIAKRLEDRLYLLFTAFIANLPGNAEYLRRHYPIASGAKVLYSPIWAETSMAQGESRELVRRRLGLPLDRPIAIFGGQFCEGRGIDQMIAAARIGEKAGAPTLYLFIGDGRLRPILERAAAECSGICVKPPIGRSDYLSLVSACDVGMVATIREFTSWAFPSKTIDYLRAGIPLVTAVEPGSDFPRLLEPYQVSENVAAGDAAAFQAAIERLARGPLNRDDVHKSARQCLDQVFDVRHAVSAVLRAVGEPADLKDDQANAIVTRMAVSA